MKPNLNHLSKRQKERHALLLKQYKLGLKQREAQSKSFPILDIKPHEKQQPVYDDVFNKKKGVVFQGGNRSGKTFWLITQTLALLYGKEFWGDRRELPFKPPVKARLLGEDWTFHIGGVLIPLLEEMAPDYLIKRKKRNQVGIDYLWEFYNGSSLELMTYEQDVKKFEGWHGHFFAADEPMPRGKYIALKRGLVDYGGIFLMSFTPLSEAWIFDEIVTSGNLDFGIHFVDIKDNPHLGEEEIKDFEASLTDDEKEARLRGQWMHLSGLVYKEFNHNTHVIPPFEGGEIPRRYTCYAAVDFHSRLPHAISIVAVDRNNHIVICDEIWRHGSPNDIADWLIDWHLKRHPLETIIIDALSKGDGNQYGGYSSHDVIDERLSAFGIPLEVGSKDVSNGIRAVQDSLMSRNNLPALFVHPHCEKHIYEFTHYLWPTQRDKTAEHRTPSQKPQDKDDHFMENLRRLVVLPAEHRGASDNSGWLTQANEAFKPVDAIAGY